MPDPQRLTVLMAFDRDPDTGELGPAFEPKQMPTEERARSEAAKLADKHDAVIAFSRTAEPDIGEYGEAVELARFGEVPELE